METQVKVDYRLRRFTYVAVIGLALLLIFIILCILYLYYKEKKDNQNIVMPLGELSKHKPIKSNAVRIKGFPGDAQGEWETPGEKTMGETPELDPHHIKWDGDKLIVEEFEEWEHTNQRTYYDSMGKVRNSYRQKIGKEDKEITHEGEIQQKPNKMKDALMKKYGNLGVQAGIAAEQFEDLESQISEEPTQRAILGMSGKLAMGLKDKLSIQQVKPQNNIISGQMMMGFKKRLGGYKDKDDSPELQMGSDHFEDYVNQEVDISLEAQDKEDGGLQNPNLKTKMSQALKQRMQISKGQHEESPIKTENKTLSKLKLFTSDQVKAKLAQGQSIDTNEPESPQIENQTSNLKTKLGLGMRKRFDKPVAEVRQFVPVSDQVKQAVNEDIPAKLPLMMKKLQAQYKSKIISEEEFIRIQSEIITPSLTQREDQEQQLGIYSPREDADISIEKFDNAAEELFHEKIVGYFPTLEKTGTTETQGVFASIDTTI